MPAALKLQEEYKDSLQVLFVEVGNANNPKMQAFAIDKGWYAASGNAMWTKEKPFDSGQKYIPAFVLLDESGKVILSGLTGSMHKEIEELIDEHAKARTKGPEDAPAQVAKLYGEFYKGKAGKALADAMALAADPGRGGEEVQTAAQAAVTIMQASLERELKRADWMLENGFYAVAEAGLDDLSKSLKGADDWLAKVTERADRVRSTELAEERKAEEALAKLEKKLFDKGTDKVSAKSLAAIGEKFPGTKAALRAESLIAIVDAG